MGESDTSGYNQLELGYDTISGKRILSKGDNHENYF